MVAETKQSSTTHQRSLPMKKKRVLKGGYQSHFLAQCPDPTDMLTKHQSHSHFGFFFWLKSQSQRPKSHFPSAKTGKSQFPFYPFRTLKKHIHVNKITRTWLCQKPNPPHIPEFYSLTKILKLTPVVRPIISGCYGPTEKLSSFVDKLLQPEVIVVRQFVIYFVYM